MGPAETVETALRNATRLLITAGVENAAADARILMCAALGCDRAALLARRGEALAPHAADAFAALVARRAAREPVSRIIGRREFWSLDFVLGPTTLDPRPDSETLVEAALAHAPEAPRILDLGTGTGCLLLALLTERPAAEGVGVDRDPAAAAIARANAGRLGLAGRAHFLCADWSHALRGPFHLVVSNPPYIPEPDSVALDPEVRLFDPPLALFGGRDGLDAYRAILRDLDRVLAPGGIVAFEHGRGQGDDVTYLLREAGLDIIATPRDLSGIERVCVAKKGIGTMRECR